MKLRTKKSHFQNLPEGAPPRRILPIIVKFAYYMVLLSVLGGICYVVAMRYLYFSGRGNVEIEKLTISSDHGGRVVNINQQIGDTIAYGDILAVIDFSIDCAPEKPDLRLTRLTYDIKLKQSEYGLYSKRLNELKNDPDVDILPRALEIGDTLSRRKHIEINKEMSGLIEKTALLAAEIAIKRKELAALKRVSAVNRNRTCGSETIRSPINGSIYHVTRQPGEHVKKGAPLFIVIPERAHVRIEAYFDRKHLRYLSKGRPMAIEFPDRTTSTGIIIDYLSSASHVPEPIQKDYLPVEAYLKVYLKPATDNDQILWKRYDRMDVRVKGERR